jgi:hypothetical protein
MDNSQAQARLGIKHRMKTNKATSTKQKTKKMSNTDPTKTLVTCIHFSFHLQLLHISHCHYRVSLSFLKTPSQLKPNIV